MSDPGALLVLGGGGHAAVVIESAHAAHWRIVGFLDDRGPSPVRVLPFGPPHLGRIDALPAALAALDDTVFVHAAIGDPALRRTWLDAAQPRPAATVVHPTAVVSPTAHVGAGVFIGPGAVINARARVDEGAIVNSGAVVEHDCTLGAFSHIAPGAVLAGSASVGADTLIGAGATVAPGVRIGTGVTLGAGAVAASDILDGVRAAGVPARSLADA